MTRPLQTPRHLRPSRLRAASIIAGSLSGFWWWSKWSAAPSASRPGSWWPRCGPHGDFGWGIGTIGALMAVYYVVGALFSPVSGWLGERYGARHLMLAGGLLYGGSMVLLGLVRQPWHFLLAFSVLLSLTQSICLVPLMAAVSGWFRRRLGLGTGISGRQAGWGQPCSHLW